MAALSIVIMAFVSVASARPDATLPHQQGEWHTSSWDSCQPEKLFQSLTNEWTTPTVGLQRRTLTCISPNTTVLAARWCPSPALASVQQRCIVKTPCRVSTWSEWRIQQQGCRGDDDQIVAEIQVRQRRVIQAPVGQVADCPMVEERRVVDQPSLLPLCNQRYKWQPSPWSACHADEWRRTASSGGGGGVAGVCGGGVQIRRLTCLRLSDSRPVNSQLCRAVTLLPVVQHCEIPCDLDCQVSDWSPWSSCIGAPCGVTNDVDDTNQGWGYQLRQRRIVSNASASGVECPALNQMRPCGALSPSDCARWQPDPIGSCQLPANRSCGHGHQQLVYRCRRVSDQTNVDETACSDWLPSTVEQTTCAVSCPADCVMSPWSEWTTCVQGIRRRTRYVVGLPAAGGAPCPPEAIQEQPCSEQPVQHQPVFSWWTFPWTQCALPDYRLCGSGTMQREVECTKDDTEHVDDFWCRMLSKPEALRTCSVACPEDCRVSDWSEWSQCSDDTEEDVIQSRIRVVLQSALHQGSPCPALIEKRSCFDWLAQQDRIRWHLSPWTPCQLPPTAKCGTGITVRSVSCRDGNNDSLDPSICLSKLYDEYRRLELDQSCHVSCDDVTCQYATSLDAGLCPRNCIGTRRNRNHLIGRSDEENGCVAQHSEEDCPCERITLQSEDWSSCLLQDHLRPCGSGQQFRRRKCLVTSISQLAPIPWCNEEDYETRRCHIPCATDCAMSQWSGWTPCNSTCGPGIRTRQRQMEVEPANNGRRCGSMEETQPCHVRSCDLFQWRASDWTPCTSSQHCGDSVQTRYVRCVNVMEELIVDDAVCDVANKPPDQQKCHIACAGDCVVSAWTPWTPCHNCQGGGDRRRRRSIIRNAMDNGACPVLEEIQSCSSQDANCWNHQWRVSEWSSCLPLGGSNCGEGIRTRIVSCFRTDGYSVNSSYCDPHSKPSLTEMWCHVECPIDCQISGWTLWDDSECTPCGHHSGLRSRHRQIQMMNNQFGRSCPGDLRQQLPCPYRPCYEWRPSNWSQCNLHGAQCGTGIRHQLADCVLAGSGKTVHPEFCRLNQQRLPMSSESLCKVPCQFEKMVKIPMDDIKDAASFLPSSFDDHVHYLPKDGEFNIWMVAMIAIGSLFLVFVGVTIFLICSSREEAGNCKRNVSVAGPSEFRSHRLNVARSSQFNE